MCTSLSPKYQVWLQEKSKVASVTSNRDLRVHSGIVMYGTLTLQLLHGSAHLQRSTIGSRVRTVWPTSKIGLGSWNSNWILVSTTVAEFQVVHPDVPWLESVHEFARLPRSDSNPNIWRIPIGTFNISLNDTSKSRVPLVTCANMRTCLTRSACTRHDQEDLRPVPRSWGHSGSEWSKK